MRWRSASASCRRRCCASRTRRAPRARSPGLKPQELPSLQPGTRPGAAAPSRRCRRATCRSREFSDLRRRARAADRRAHRPARRARGAARARLRQPQVPADAVSDPRRLVLVELRLPDRSFTGQQSIHEGIDFPAEAGTPIVAAASGKVIFADWHPAYGKMLEIDHGNGLVSRYAHTSSVMVKEGDLVVRGQRVATVGLHRASTGPHLHFEVRLNGVPQNPARFLQASSFNLSAIEATSGGRECVRGEAVLTPCFLRAAERNADASPTTSMISNILTRIFGSRNERLLKQYGAGRPRDQRARARDRRALRRGAAGEDRRAQGPRRATARRSTRCCPRRSPSCARPASARCRCATSTSS